MNYNSSYSPLNSGKYWRFSSYVTLKFERCPKKTIGHLVYAASSLVNHSVVFCEFKLKLRSGNAKIGAKFVLTSVTLILDFWPCPFAWTSLLLMVISLANSMMIGWGKHCKRVWRTDGQTDKQIDGTVHWAAWSLQKKRTGSEEIIQNAAMVIFYIFRMIQELIIRWIDSFVVCLHAPFLSLLSWRWWHCEFLGWGTWFMSAVPRAGTRNCITHYLLDAITYPCPWCRRDSRTL